MKTSFNKITIILIGVAFLFTTCRKDEKQSELSKTSVQVQENTYGKRPGQCSCGTRHNSLCTDECTTEFMSGLEAKTFTIQWTSCLGVSPDCLGTPSPNQSNVKFCYQSHTAPDWNGCALLMEIDNLPSCIKCIGVFPRCIKFHAYCNTGAGVLELVADDPDVSSANVEWEVTIQGDPVLKLCCKQYDLYGGYNEYCCSGELVADPDVQ